MNFNWIFSLLALPLMVQCSPSSEEATLLKAPAETEESAESETRYEPLVMRGADYDTSSIAGEWTAKESTGDRIFRAATLQIESAGKFVLTTSDEQGPVERTGKLLIIGDRFYNEEATLRFELKAEKLHEVIAEKGDIIYHRTTAAGPKPGTED